MHQSHGTTHLPVEDHQREGRRPRGAPGYQEPAVGQRPGIPVAGRVDGQHAVATQRATPRDLGQPAAAVRVRAIGLHEDQRAVGQLGRHVLEPRANVGPVHRVDARARPVDDRQPEAAAAVGGGTGAVVAPLGVEQAAVAQHGRRQRRAGLEAGPPGHRSPAGDRRQRACVQMPRPPAAQRLELTGRIARVGEPRDPLREAGGVQRVAAHVLGLPAVPGGRGHAAQAGAVEAHLPDGARPCLVAATSEEDPLAVGRQRRLPGPREAPHERTQLAVGLQDHQPCARTPFSGEPTPRAARRWRDRGGHHRLLGQHHRPGQRSGRELLGVARGRQGGDREQRRRHAHRPPEAAASAPHRGGSRTTTVERSRGAGTRCTAPEGQRTSSRSTRRAWPSPKCKRGSLCDT